MTSLWIIWQSRIQRGNYDSGSVSTARGRASRPERRHGILSTISLLDPRRVAMENRMTIVSRQGRHRALTLTGSDSSLATTRAQYADTLSVQSYPRIEPSMTLSGYQQRDKYFSASCTALLRVARTKSGMAEFTRTLQKYILLFNG